MEEGAPKGPLKNPKEVKGALEGSITMKMQIGLFDKSDCGVFGRYLCGEHEMLLTWMVGSLGGHLGAPKEIEEDPKGSKVLKI